MFSFIMIRIYNIRVDKDFVFSCYPCCVQKLNFSPDTLVKCEVLFLFCFAYMYLSLCHLYKEVEFCFVHCTVGPFIWDLCTSARTFQYNLRSVLGAWWFRTLVILVWWYSQVIKNQCSFPWLVVTHFFHWQF